MSVEATVEVKGLKELETNLRQLQERIATKGLRESLRKSGRAFVDAMKPLIHSTGGAEQSKDEKDNRRHLADSLIVRTKVDKYGDATAKVGPTRKLAHIANWLEFGTAPHIIKAKHGKALLIAGGHPVFEVQHPGTPARPFMRPAFDCYWEQALEKFKSELASYIEKKS